MSKSMDRQRSSRHSRSRSFSSLLLDSIYRSMEAEEGGDSTRPTPPSLNLKRAIMIDHWIEAQQQEHKEKQPASRRSRNRASCTEAHFASCFTPPKPLKISIRSPFSASRSTASTPSARLAAFFNSIFTPGRRRRSKPAPPPQSTSPRLTNLGRYLPDKVKAGMDDDVESDASSDLFELEIGGRPQYQQELPLYGTTSFEMNKAVANAFRV